MIRFARPVWDETAEAELAIALLEGECLHVTPAPMTDEVLWYGTSPRFDEIARHAVCPVYVPTFRREPPPRLQLVSLERRDECVTCGASSAGCPHCGQNDPSERAIEETPYGFRAACSCGACGSPDAETPGEALRAWRRRARRTVWAV